MSKILLLTNHSYKLYWFHREPIQVPGAPFMSHKEDFRATVKAAHAKMAREFEKSLIVDTPLRAILD